MQPDQFLVLGLFLGVMAIPAILSAWSDRRTPRVGAVVLIGGLGLVLHAIDTRPGGYGAQEVSDAVYGVIADILR
ncbi:hypothetical protein [Salipiger sp.]|uniref:hypothetical protein n=1 Tax=Salipiger sp. TaxID=2078585 RepID=UPI003A97CD50